MYLIFLITVCTTNHVRRRTHYFLIKKKMKVEFKKFVLTQITKH